MQLKQGVLALCLSLFLTSGESQAMPVNDTNGFHSKYLLKEAVLLSRHNIRSPLSDKGSDLEQITPHKWFNWTSGPSELSLRGGQLETMMGQYFRKYFESEGLFEENAQPKDGEVRIYANSTQRTIATAHYFVSGMLPVADIAVEHKFAPSKMDPVFCPQLTFISEAFKEKALQQIQAMGGAKGFTGICEDLKDSYRVLENTLDLKNSEKARKEGFTKFRYDDLKIILEQNEEPKMKGSLKTATSASDAFILQYYEEKDPLKAGFGHKLSLKDWELISRIKDVYIDVLFTAPVVAVNVAHPLLKDIRKELTTDGRKFAFLCGHDSNIGSVLAALENEPYLLPDSIEKKTPIGSKLAIEKWLGRDGKEYVSLNLVYQSTTQLRERTSLDLKTQPVSYPIFLKGLEKNADGLYRLEDVLERFDKAISAYDDLPEDADEHQNAA